MTKNPFLNALCASLYIVFVATLMNYAHNSNLPEEGILIPITVLSLFVLSAAVMGFIFFYQPAQLYLGGQQKEAVHLFLKTLGSFAVITLLLLALLFLSATT